jgi:hypothetical protein
LVAFAVTVSSAVLDLFGLGSYLPRGLVAAQHTAAQSLSCASFSMTILLSFPSVVEEGLVDSNHLYTSLLLATLGV